MKIKLSVTIITFNEEKYIRQCIESVQNIADEIIVLDSFSTDKTEKICHQLGVNFYKHKFDGHIEQKNRAISLTSNDFVLSLDADETLSDKLNNSIAKIKNNCLLDAYTFNRITNYCGKCIRYCGWYPDKKLRIWNKNKGKWGGTNPHDKVIMQKGCNIQHIKGDLLHYSYDDVQQHLKQIQYFTDIMAKAEYQKGKQTNLFHLIFKPFWAFIRAYFLKLGFMDGYYGFVISINGAYYKYIKYLKLNELNRKKLK